MGDGEREKNVDNSILVQVCLGSVTHFSKPK